MSKSTGKYIYVLHKDSIYEGDEIEDIITNVSTDVKDLIDSLVLNNIRYPDNIISVFHDGVFVDDFIVGVEYEDYSFVGMLNEEVEYFKQLLNGFAKKLKEFKEEQRRKDDEEKERKKLEKDRKEYERLKKIFEGDD